MSAGLHCVDHSVSEWCPGCGWTASPSEAAAAAQKTAALAKAAIDDHGAARQELERRRRLALDIGIVLLSARDGDYSGLESPRLVPEEPAHATRWWTPIAEVNRATQGGLYGITGLGGSAGAGKSFFALATALRAVLRDEQQVVYLAAEMALEQIQERMLWIAKSWGHTREQLSAELESGRFTLFYRKGRVSWKEICGEIASVFYEAPTGLLVLDSINSLLASLAPGEGYWTAYESILETLLTTRKITEGRFAALVLSELNQRGGSKGEKLEYASDLMLNFKHTTTPKVYDVRITKNRERGSDGPIGKFSITPEGGYARVHV